MQGVLITDDIGASDIMNDGFPYRFYAGELLKGGELPLWYPPVYGGFPLVARAESGVCYPPNLILFWLLNPYVALNCVILLTLLTAALGMYLYAREIGAGVPGALLAALAFAYSGFMVSHLKHLSMVNAACWFPLGLLAIEKGLRGGALRGGAATRRAMLSLGAVFALQILSGHIQIAYYAALGYAAYFIARAAHIRRAERTGSLRALGARTGATWFALAMALGAIAGAVQLIPTYELVGYSGRAHGVSLAYATEYDYDPAMAATFLYPPVVGEASRNTYRGTGVYWEDYGYVGVITLLLAVIALLKDFRSTHVRFFAFAAACAFLVVIGGATPLFAAIFNVVPFMKYFRFPSRMLFIVDASLALLGGLGLGSLTAQGTPPGSRRPVPPGAVAWGALALALADLLFFQLPQNAIAPRAEWERPPRTAEALAHEGGRIYSQGGILTHIAAYSEAEGWRGSLAPYIDQREYLQPSLHVLYGLASADGYAQLTPGNVVDVWGDQNRRGMMDSLWRVGDGRFTVRFPYMRLLALNNVRTILSPLPIAGEPLAFRGMVGPVRIYDNPAALPRAFIVGGWRLAHSDTESLALLASESFHPEREAILRDDPGVPPRDSVRGEATITLAKANRVTIRSVSPVSALLVLSDTFYPGWEAAVDGSPRPILLANHTMRAVVVPAGAHEVTFAFRPASVMTGFILSLAGILGLVVIALPRGRHAP